MNKPKQQKNVDRGRKALDAGKRFERKVAKDVGGVRVGGRGDSDLRKSYDVYTETIVFECKHRNKKPSVQQILQWLSGVIKRAEKEKKLGVLCLHVGKGSSEYWFVHKTDIATLWFSNLHRNPFTLRTPY